MNKAILLIVGILLLANCKKTDTPSPESGSGSRYRLKAYMYNENNYTSFIYNAAGNCIQITGTVEGITKVHKVFQYNDQDVVTQFKDKHTNKSYQYTYTADNLVSTCKRYSDTTFTTLDCANTYYYGSNNNLDCVVSDYEVGIKDSLVFTHYVHGRPLQSLRYTTSKHHSNKYYIKYKYTYDSRMNRIKTESSIANDSSSFFTETETHFFTVNNQDLWHKIAGTNGIQAGAIQDDPNYSSSQNKDSDFAVGNTYYSSCGIYLLDESEVLSWNELGLPVTVKVKSTSYNCNQDTDGPSIGGYTMVYETY